MKMMDVAQLNNLRKEGNQFFSKGNYWRGIELYTRCIWECEKTLGSSGGPGEEDEIRHTFLLACSNRAEANLQLKRFDDALADADKALELNANDGKSLNRRARALEGLQRFREANLAYLASLKQRPEDQDIREALIRTKICSVQSEKGEYDLSKFYLGGSRGSFEPCAEYVGPVDIRRASSGGRGLFATRDVVAGELLLVSKAMGIAQGFEECRVGLQLAELSDSSARHRHQLHSLAHTDSQEGLKIPSMELFLPGNGWRRPTEKVPEDQDCDLTGIMYYNSFKLHGATADASEFYDPNPPRRTGVWALPSFLNHSCSPNTLRMHVGEAMFVRAAQPISSGEELTMTYVDTSDVIQNRQKTCQTWGFQCRCPRCKFEQEFEPLHKMSKIFYDLVHSHNAGTVPGHSLTAYMASHYEGVEKIISSAPHLTPQQKNWIRASCIYAYMGKTGMVQDDLELKIPVLTQMVEAEMLLSPGNITGLQHSCDLLRDVRKHYGKRSAKYAKTDKHILEIFRITYGTDNQKALLYLIERIQKLG